MPDFLVMQSSYQDVECALFKGGVQLEAAVLEKVASSSLLIPMLQQLFMRHDVTLNALAFIAVNRGPAPFTTLRVVIATANALQYASKVPLIGVTSFEAWFRGLSGCGMDAAILMNAFNREVYFGIQRLSESTFTASCVSFEKALHTLVALQSKAIVIVGNATQLYRQAIKEALGDRAIFAQERQTMNSVYDLALVAHKQWSLEGAYQGPLEPFYLKNSVR